MQKAIDELKQQIDGTLLYLVITGSRAYGLDTPDSDYDFRGVYMPEAKYLLGLHSSEHFERKDPDIVLKSLKEFVRLALGANPNIIEQLFIANPLFVHPLFQPFLNKRKLFLSQRVRKTYVGYAIGQLRKLEAGHTRDLGAKRKALVEKFGYDCKNAMHCFRLLIQGQAILETGQLDVKIQDPAIITYLKDIRAGKVFANTTEVREKAEKMISRVDIIKSQLPENPDYDAIEKLMIDCHMKFLAERRDEL